MSRRRELARKFLSELLEEAEELTPFDDRFERLRIGQHCVEELAGFFDAIMAVALPAPHVPDALDTCGTGGDGRGTINVSTISALFAACMGVKVAKCGNRASTSLCGSADFLEALGVPICLPAQHVALMMRETNFGFFFTQAFHPRLAVLAPVRRLLGYATVFNLLGPLCNPARCDCRLIGLSRADLFETYEHLVREVGGKRALLVTSSDGLDELSPSAEIFVREVSVDRTRSYTIDPQSCGIRYHNADELLGGRAAENVKLFHEMTQGADPARLEFCVLNLGAALWAAERAKDLTEGCHLARHALTTESFFRNLSGLLNWRPPSAESDTIHGT